MSPAACTSKPSTSSSLPTMLASTEPVRVLKATTPAAATFTDTPLPPPTAIEAARAKAWMLSSDSASTVTVPAVASTVELSIVASVPPSILLLARAKEAATPTETPPLAATEMAAEKSIARMAELSCAITSTLPVASTSLSTTDASTPPSILLSATAPAAATPTAALPLTATAMAADTASESMILESLNWIVLPSITVTR